MSWNPLRISGFPIYKNIHAMVHARCGGSIGASILSSE